MSCPICAGYQGSDAARLLEPGDIFSCDSNPYQLAATRDHAVALDFETSMAIARIPPDFEQGAPMDRVEAGLVMTTINKLTQGQSARVMVRDRCLS